MTLLEETAQRASASPKDWMSWESGHGFPFHTFPFYMNTIGFELTKNIQNVFKVSK